jgi:glycogen operon protein
MPVQRFVNDRHLLDRGLTNFWGYNTIGFFAPDPRYAADPSNVVSEFQEMVTRFHDAGIEVILDVVYNHSAEGNELGPTLAFRGLDNASYYRLVPDQCRYYNNDAGTGNTLNPRHPRVTQMIMDSLRYWAAEMRVDGFRFDLGTTLSRPDECFDQHSAFLTACIQDPVLSAVKLIAEPWDCGPGGYQMGGFPPGWAEWNDRYRDTVRLFWNHGARAGELSPRLCGSSDIFERRGRKPWASVNFIAAHDGFTAADVVSYVDKHNDANLDGNADGTSDNRSANYGTEGPTSDAAIVRLRERQVRNMLATLLCSQGTPMLLAGDEFGRSQAGNNNAYCQDNQISWIDWQLAIEHADLVNFVRSVIALRKSTPSLRQSHFLRGEPIESTGFRDVTWLTPANEEFAGAAWSDPACRALGMLLGNEPPCLLLLNPLEDELRWVLPACPAGRRWSCRLDSSFEIAIGGAAGDVLTVAGRSVVVLVAA